MTTTPFTTYSFATIDGTSTRTMPQRLADIYNVKDFGAVGDDVAFDTTAIRAALAAMYAADNHRGNHSGAVFFPPGKYKVDAPIDIGSASATNCTGSIIGPCRGGTAYVHGDLPNGFVFYNLDGVNSVGEIANISIGNDSTVIGSGAFFVNNTSLVCNNVAFGGMICVLQGNNLYDVHYNNCVGGPGFNATTGYNGTFGIAGGCCNIQGWRTSANFMTAFTFEGTDNASITGCGVENCAVVVLLGATTGWASTCTVAPDGGHPGSSILTIGGTIGNANLNQFANGSILYMKGLDLPTWGNDPFDSTGGVTITANHSNDGTLTGDGFGAGTYRISGTYTISSAVPLVSRGRANAKTVHIRGLQSEACIHQVYVQSVTACTVESVFGGSATGECPNQFGATGLTPRAGIFVQNAASTVIRCCEPTQGYLGSVAFASNGILSNVTCENVIATKTPDCSTTGQINLTGSGGGAGFIMNISATDGNYIGNGMHVTGSGVDTYITRNNAIDNTLTGNGGTGTYRVADSLNFASGSLTIHSGADWLLPTAPDSKTALKIINCGSKLPAGVTATGLDAMNMTFSALPGESAASGYIYRISGDEFFIVDGAKSGGGTALVGDATQGGGTQHIKVGWNGTSWIRSW